MVKCNHVNQMKDLLPMVRKETATTDRKLTDGGWVQKRVRGAEMELAGWRPSHWTRWSGRRTAESNNKRERTG